MCVFLCVHMSVCAFRDQKTASDPGTGVIDCELPGVGARTRALVA